MANIALHSTDSDSALSLSELEKFAAEWFFVGEIFQHSAATLDLRRLIVRNLLWFLRRKKTRFLRQNGTSVLSRLPE